ncbi:MAG TPA: biopolymer transporter ExbD [Steroidobacteraceae bacterium]|nr:biopolymer transporter ExbD [Steroidobacteraceae bacterium]
MSVESSIAEPQLNATPLIDVMLVLLVILIITLPVATHAVKLNLPHRTGGTPPPSIRVDIVADGAIYWNGEELTSLDQLRAKFVAAASDSAAPRINVVPENRARYELVAQVLALAQRSRVTALGLAPVEDRIF